MSAPTRAPAQDDAVPSTSPDTDGTSSLAEQYSVMASEDFAPRRVDVALRALDLVIAGTALLLLSPLLGLLALATLLTSGTPVLYRGERVGRAGRIFTMYKLRTLKRGAEERLGNVYGEELSRRTEQEVTLVGEAARLTHIDTATIILPSQKTEGRGAAFLLRTATA